MLLAHADPTARFDEIFRGARIQGPLVCLDLEGDELDEFLRAFEETANSAQNDVAMERLGQAFARIDAGLAGKTDPGWHMLRPAISRLDVTPKHGQYLAFIHMYTRLHRRAPAESDIQNFFSDVGSQRSRNTKNASKEAPDQLPGRRGTLDDSAARPS